jgi:hypothetical protein
MRHDLTFSAGAVSAAGRSHGKALSAKNGKKRLTVFGGNHMVISIFLYIPLCHLKASFAKNTKGADFRAFSNSLKIMLYRWSQELR